VSATTTPAPAHPRAREDRRPAVSVIVPTYQRRAMVTRAIASVLAQTYDDLEVIVVDDGSTDGTREAVLRLGERVRYEWQPNRGVSAARNRGLRIARGSIVAFLDSDDRWLPDHLAVLTRMLEEHPQAVLATTSPKRVIGGRAGPARAYIYDPTGVYFFAITFGYPSCVAVRRDALAATGEFDERMQVHEAVDLFMRIALQGPYCMLQRRTIVKHYTAGLKDWGCRSGNYLDAFEYRARRDLSDFTGAADPRRRALATQAQAALALTRAMRALHERDDPGLRSALAEACRLAPQLSHEFEAVQERFDYMPFAHESGERLRYLATVGRAWPEPESDTALYLRLSTAMAALRRREPAAARDALANWPLRRTIPFSRRAVPALARRARRRIDARRHRDEHRVDLDGRTT
jgi:GT2 family glycosyltransferase